MTLLLAEFKALEATGSPYEFIFLGVAVLITLALLVGFIVVIMRSQKQ